MNKTTGKLYFNIMNIFRPWGFLPGDCQTYDEWFTYYSKPLVNENSHPDR